MQRIDTRFSDLDRVFATGWGQRPNVGVKNAKTLEFGVLNWMRSVATRCPENTWKSSQKAWEKAIFPRAKRFVNKSRLRYAEIDVRFSVLMH